MSSVKGSSPLKKPVNWGALSVILAAVSIALSMSAVKESSFPDSMIWLCATYSWIVSWLPWLASFTAIIALASGVDRQYSWRLLAKLVSFGRLTAKVLFGITFAGLLVCITGSMFGLFAGGSNSKLFVLNSQTSPEINLDDVREGDSSILQLSYSVNSVLDLEIPTTHARPNGQSKLSIDQVSLKLVDTTRCSDPQPHFKCALLPIRPMLPDEISDPGKLFDLDAQTGGVYKLSHNIQGSKTIFRVATDSNLVATAVDYMNLIRGATEIGGLQVWTVVSLHLELEDGTIIDTLLCGKENEIKAFRNGAPINE